VIGALVPVGPLDKDGTAYPYEGKVLRYAFCSLCYHVLDAWTFPYFIHKTMLACRSFR